MKTNATGAQHSSNRTVASQATKLPLRRWVRVTHLWAGLSLGLWLVMLGVTGSALVYQHSLRQAFEPGRKIRSGLPALPIDEMLARVHRQRPDLTVVEIHGMEHPDSATELVTRPVDPEPTEKHTRILLVDPGTGEIGAEQTPTGTFMGWLAELHYNLFLGKTGLALNAFAGAASIFFAITGLILWWRGKAKWKNGLRLKLRGVSSRVRTYSIHSAIGFYASLFLAITGLSGIYVAVPRPFLSAASYLQGSSVSATKHFLDPPLSTSKPGVPDAPASEIIKIALAKYPQSVPSEIDLPITPHDAWQFHFIPRSALDLGEGELVSIDRRSAEVLAVERTSDLPFAIRIIIFLRPLHAGSFAGEFSMALWAVLGLTPAILFVTGLLMWRKRIAAMPAPPA